MTDNRWAAGMMYGQGVLLVLVAVAHLVMTAEIGRIVAHNTTPAAYRFLWPPYALDHIVVGILLFGVGAIQLVCAGGIRADAPRIRLVTLVNALCVLALTPALMLTVGMRYFMEAPVFLGAAATLVVLGAWMVLPLLLTRRQASRVAAKER